MKLALGTVQFGMSYGIANADGQVKQEEATAMLKVAASHGIDTLDTAISYGNSESVLGDAGVNGFRVVTKLPAVPEPCPDVSKWVNAQLRASLNRLDTDFVDGLLLHRSGQLAGPDGGNIYHALSEVRDKGLARKIGVSIYDPSELEMLPSHLRIDLVQAPLNLVDRRIATSGWLKRLKQDGVEVHTRSAFLQGLLLMPRTEIPSKFETWSQLWNQWHDWLSKYSLSDVQACLSFPMSLDEVDRVVVGANNVQQLTEIITAARRPPIASPPDLQCDDESLINPSHWSNS